MFLQVDQLRYEIIGNERAQRFYFIDHTSGHVSLKTLLTESDHDDDQIRIRVRDQSVPEKSAEVTLQVRIERDKRAPRFSRDSYTASVSEQVAVGSIVQPQDGGVSASDEDLVSTLTYALTGVFPASNFFAVNNESAEIRVARDLREDAVRAPVYTLRITAIDAIYPNNVGTCTVTVNVERNPNDPRFNDDEYDVTIDERHPLGDVVLTVAASDEDGDDVTFELSGDDVAMGFFYVNAATGVITTRASLLQTDVTDFRLTATAIDDGVPSKRVNKQVRVTVTRDVFAPVFAEQETEADEVLETVPLGSRVAAVIARDGDLKGQLHYTLVGEAPAPEFFEVDLTTGVVTVKQRLDEDYSPSYTVRLPKYYSLSP